MKQLSVNKAFYFSVVMVFLVSCVDLPKTENTNSVIDPCLLLTQLNSTDNKKLLLDIRSKRGLVDSLKSLGLSNYVMGTSKDKPTFVDSLVTTNPSFNEGVKIYHRFYNDSLPQQVVIFELMKPFEDKKYNQSGELLIYLENGEGLNWHACTAINTETIASSQKSRLFLN